MSEARSQEALAYLSATEQLALFRSRDLSPVEVLQAQIARADALAETVNALTWRFNERALEQAKAAEARYLGQGDAPRALEGITLAIKEEMPVAGDPVTSASLVYKDAIAQDTAPLAEHEVDMGDAGPAEVDRAVAFCVLDVPAENVAALDAIDDDLEICLRPVHGRARLQPYLILVDEHEAEVVPCRTADRIDGEALVRDVVGSVG